MRDTTLAKTNNPADRFEGDWASKVELHDTINTFESITTQEYLWYRQIENAIWNLNYKSDIPLHGSN
jgi:hypothetical protein